MTLNLLSNPSFDIGGGQSTVESNGASARGSAAAQGWSTLLYPASERLTTSVMPTTLPGHRHNGGRMLHVCTTGLGEVGQTFASDGTAPRYVKASAWVFVVRGAVALGVGNGSDYIRGDAKSSTVGEWELLEARNGVCPANHLIVGSAVEAMEEGACFFIDNASVEEISEEEWRALGNGRAEAAPVDTSRR